MKKDDVFDQCMALAMKSSMLHKHGAIIYRNGEIIGQGYNHITTYMCHNFSCHAEVAAINSVKKKDKIKLKESTLVVMRVGNDGNVKLSKPCEDCSTCIKKHGIKRVFYST